MDAAHQMSLLRILNIPEPGEPGFMARIQELTRIETDDYNESEASDDAVFEKFFVRDRKHSYHDNVEAREDALDDFVPPGSVRCRYCGCQGERHVVCWENVNGNGGRPYYICPNTECPGYDWRRGQNWITWADGKGIDDSNPKCYCRRRSRQNEKGARTSRPGEGFWNCARGVCDYWSDDLRGLTTEQLLRTGEQWREFRPWMFTVEGLDSLLEYNAWLVQRLKGELAPSFVCALAEDL